MEHLCRALALAPVQQGRRRRSWSASRPRPLLQSSCPDAVSERSTSRTFAASLAFLIASGSRGIGDGVGDDGVGDAGGDAARVLGGDRTVRAEAFRWRRGRFAAADWGVDGMLVEVEVSSWGRSQT